MEMQGKGGSDGREFTRDMLFARLDGLGIAHQTVEHPPIMTVDEGRDYKASMPGGHSKNMFLKDKKGALFFVTAHCDTQVDLVALGRHLEAKGRLSFGKPDLMLETLGVTPGSVTPFALGFPGAAAAFRAVVVDRAFHDHDPVWFHPLENTASTAISPASLIAYIRDCGAEPIELDLTALTRD